MSCTEWSSTKVAESVKRVKKAMGRGTEGLADGTSRGLVALETNGAASAGHEDRRGESWPAMGYAEPGRRPNVPDFPA